MSEQQLDLEAIKGRIRKAHDMVHALCQPKYSAGTREWLMSIPARPDYDPDLVIGDALNGADKLLAELERTRVALAALVDAAEAGDVCVELDERGWLYCTCCGASVVRGGDGDSYYGHTNDCWFKLLHEDVTQAKALIDVKEA